jgi:SAM-dependent methyltransferase
MREELLESLACPADAGQPLELRDARRVSGVVQEGTLRCPRCGARFAIEAGVARFLDHDRLPEVKRKEMVVRDRSYSNDYKVGLERLAEFDAVQVALGDAGGLRVLDAGCGLGQMTAAVRGARDVVGMDFSWEGLLHFRTPSGLIVDLVQADACRMPFRIGAFDLAVSCQLLEHVHSRELRGAFLAQLAATLRVDGRAVVTTYNWDRGRRDGGIPKEGLHGTGIYYYCYEAGEFRTELSPYFDVEAMWAVDVVLPGTYRLVNVLGSKQVYWDRLWRARPLSLPFGRLLLAICHRRGPTQAAPDGGNVAP